MHPADDEMLVEAAAQCEDCVGWVEFCQAECCHVFTFALTPRSDVVYLEDVVRIHTPLTQDTARYYELHGATVEEGEIVVVPRACCEVSASRLVVRMSCRELRDDCLCGIHDDDQPDCCRGFTLETVSDEGWLVTPRCLFLHKSSASRGG